MINANYIKQICMDMILKNKNHLKHENQSIHLHNI